MAESSRLEPYTPSSSDEGWIDRVDESVRDTLRKRSAEHKRLAAAVQSPDEKRWLNDWDRVAVIGERSADSKLKEENRLLRERIRELEDCKAPGDGAKGRK